MIVTRLFQILFIAFMAAACVAPQSRHDGGTRNSQQHSGDECSTSQSAAQQQSCKTDFLIAPVPRFDGDGRTQEEIDLETIGRKE